MICSKEFSSEAKEYDPFIFKIIKVKKLHMNEIPNNLNKKIIFAAI